MSWDKFWKASSVKHYPGKMEVEKYVYTPGIHGLEMAKALKEGRILGMRCGDTVYVPPRTFCPDGERGELVDVTDEEWIVAAFTVITRDMYGNPVEPQVVALVRPIDAEGGLFHYINAEPDEVWIGMRVRPVFRPEGERRGLITDIRYFEPA